MNVDIFLQARVRSSRLPGKALKTICGKTVTELIVERLKRVKGARSIILVTGPREENKALVAEAKRLNIPFFCGSEDNLLDRFYQASRAFPSDAIVRVTGDCPLVAAEVLEQGIAMLQEKKCDVVSNVRVRTFPDGMDFEAFKSSALQRAWEEQAGSAPSPTKRLLEDPAFTGEDVLHAPDLSRIRLTLDYAEDLRLIEEIYSVLYKEGEYFGLQEIVDFLLECPELLRINEKFIKLDYGIKTDQHRE